MPHVISGSWFVDLRLPVMLPFIIIASTRFEPLSRRVVLPIAVVALAVLGVRVWTVSQTWRDYDRWFTEFRTASSVIAPAARLLVVQAPIPPKTRRLPGVPEILANLQPALFLHMPSLAVIDRAAFVACMFTGWKTLEVAPRNQEISETGGWTPITPEELIEIPNSGQVQTFDYVLWIDFANAPKPQLNQLELLTTGSYFSIYRVVRP
jgi:hypothetical protein